jgi:hypothetical protein
VAPEEFAVVAELALSLEPRITIPYDSPTLWDASPNETPYVNLRDVLQPCIVRDRRELCEAMAGHSDTDAELKAMNAAPDLVRIKCEKRKYFMLHKDDNRWYLYSRK